MQHATCNTQHATYNIQLHKVAHDSILLHYTCWKHLSHQSCMHEIMQDRKASGHSHAHRKNHHPDNSTACQDCFICTWPAIIAHPDKVTACQDCLIYTQPAIIAHPDKGTACQDCFICTQPAIIAHSDKGAACQACLICFSPAKLAHTPCVSLSQPAKMPHVAVL